MAKSETFDPKTGIYTSPRPPVRIPKHSNINLVSYLFQNFSSVENDVALVDSDSEASLTFGELRVHVSKLAHALLRLGIQKNDVVLLSAPNSVHFTVCFLAVAAVGAVVSTCNPAFTAAELSRQVRDCEPRLAITVPELSDRFENLKLPAILLNSSHFRNLGTKSKSTRSGLFWNYPDLIATSTGASDLPDVDVGQADVAALFYSSGTTGVSKGVVLTHRNFIAADTMAAAALTEKKKKEKEVAMCFLPMFHIYGMLAVVYGPLRRGSTVVTVAKFEMEKTMMAVEKHRVTHLFVVPPVMVELAKKSAAARYDLSSVRVLMSGAAPLGRDVMKECARNFPLAKITQAYGMTEASGFISVEHPEEGTHLSGSSGKLIPGLEARIVCVETGKDLSPNKKGEIWLRGPNMMQGYFKNPEATKLTVDDKGWVHSGDLGYFDDKGQLFIVDRIKELIKCNGFQVAPAELEELLLSHPEILEATVIPFPEEKAGEVPIAYVVRAPNSELTEESVMNFVAKRVVTYKRLRRVTFVNTIPKSPSGKILRRLMIQKARSNM